MHKKYVSEFTTTYKSDYHIFQNKVVHRRCLHLNECVYVDNFFRVVTFLTSAQCVFLLFKTAYFQKHNTYLKMIEMRFSFLQIHCFGIALSHCSYQSWSRCHKNGISPTYKNKSLSLLPSAAQICMILLWIHSSFKQKSLKNNTQTKNTSYTAYTTYANVTNNQHYK